MSLDAPSLVIILTQATIVGIWARTARHVAQLKLLPTARDLLTGQRKNWPRLSILVPALNEGRTIRAALETILRIDYPEVEIICVNDRSTDDTGSVIDELAARDARVKAIHITELPAGWLGKTHALDTALARASGDFILFTDADVHFEPDALKRVVALMEHRRLDHLSLMPHIEPAGFLFDSALLQAGWVLFFFIDPATMGTDDCRAPMGVGAFNMVRGDLARRLQPFKRLRMEVIDDIGLAILAHQGGGKSAIYASGSAVSLEYYADYGAMVRGLEKNAFALSQFSVARATRDNLFVILAPLVAFAWPFFRGDLTMVSAAFTYAAACFLQYRSLGTYSVNPWMIPTFPLGMILCGYAGFRSMIQTLRRGGIDWRGTFYPLDELRRMQVTKLPIARRTRTK